MQQDLQPDGLENPETYTVIEETDMCFNPAYSPLVRPPEKYVPLQTWYEDDRKKKPFLELVKSRGESGREVQTPHDVGCRHLSLSQLPETINQMCHFAKKHMTGAKWMANMLDDVENNLRDRYKKGIGVSFADATPRQVLEGVTSKSLTTVQVQPPNQIKLGFVAQVAYSLGVRPSVGPIRVRAKKGEVDLTLANVAVATMSMGPVQFGDDLSAMEPKDWKKLTMCCSADGTVLRPSAALGFHDNQLSTVNEYVTVYNAHSSVKLIGVDSLGDELFGTTFLIEESREPQSYASDTLTGIPNVYTTADDKCTFSDTIKMPLAFTPALYSATRAWPYSGGRVAFFGDLSKIVPLSPQRIESVKFDGEKILISVYNPKTNAQVPDEIELGFCITDTTTSDAPNDIIKATMRLMEWSAEAETTIFSFDIATQEITCESCAKCVSCSCPDSCAGKCSLYESEIQTGCEGLSPMPDYTVCKQVEGGEWCLQNENNECPEDEYFTTEIKECGMCVPASECLSCENMYPDSLGECSCESDFECPADTSICQEGKCSVSNFFNYNHCRRRIKSMCRSLH